MTVSFKITVFCGVMPCGLVYAYKAFYVQKTVLQIQGVIGALKEGGLPGCSPPTESKILKTEVL